MKLGRKSIYLSHLVILICLSSLIGAEEQASTQRVADQANAFALSFYSRICMREGNLVFSPYSIFSALAWAYAGARGKTAQEMAQGLHLPLGLTLWPADLAALNREFDREGNMEGQKLLVANSMWTQQGMQLLKEYVRMTRETFGTNPREADFKNQAETARQTINQWVEAETQERIKDLIPEGGIDPQTRAVLTNAVYFRGIWVKAFDHGDTKPLAYTLLDGQSETAPMMHMIARRVARYAEGADWQVLELPYKGKALSMVFILPRKSADTVEPPGAAAFAAFEQLLTPQKLQSLLRGLQTTDVDITLPKFTFSPALRLKEMLSSLGLRTVFSQDADFSGMTNDKIFISEVFHKAFIAVDEKGTEAAAATALVMQHLALVARPTRIVTFRADHPFIFLIRHQTSGAILFMGRVVNPSEQKG